MPTIKISMSTQTDEKRKAIIEALTNAASDATGIPTKSFTVYIDEYDRAAIGVDGVPLSEK